MSRRESLLSTLTPWLGTVGIPILISILIINNNFIWILVAFAIIQHTGCVKDIYISMLILENTNKDNLIVFPPTKYKFDGVIKI